MFKKFNFLKYYGTKISIFQWRIKNFGPKCLYLIFEVVNFRGFWGPAEMRGNDFEEKRSFHQYSCNYEVGTTWTSLIGWPHRTSTTYSVIKKDTALRKSKKSALLSHSITNCSRVHFLPIKLGNFLLLNQEIVRQIWL